jgi:hypothetical protein
MFFTHRLSHDAPRRQVDDIDLHADQLLAGILFHLIDEQLAVAVDQTSVRSTSDRLANQSARGTIRRRMWEAMTNAQRLTWLLLRTQTMVVIDAHGGAQLKPIQAGWPPLLVAREAAVR